MSGKRSRDKGYRTERNINLALQEAGFACERVPNSGSSHGRFGGDLSLPVLGVDCRVEVKCRADGFKVVRDAIKDVPFAVLKADNEEPLWVMRQSKFIELVKAAERGKQMPYLPSND